MLIPVGQKSSLNEVKGLLSFQLTGKESPPFGTDRGAMNSERS